MAEVSMLFILRIINHHSNFCAADPLSHIGFHLQAESFDIQFRKLLFQVSRIHAQVHKGPQVHVPANPRKTIVI